MEHVSLDVIPPPLQEPLVQIPVVQPPPVTPSLCKKVWYQARNITAIAAQSIVIYVAIQDFCTRYVDMSATLIAGTILTLIMLLFDLVTRADMISQYLCVSDYTNVTIGVCCKEESSQDLNDPVIMIYRKNKMSIVMTYLILIRSILGLSLGWSVMFRPDTLIFRIIWYNQVLHFTMWMGIIRIRTSIRYERASNLRSEISRQRHVEYMEQHRLRMATVS